MLYIRPWDFARQLTTFRAVGPAPASALAAFGKLFLGELWQVYVRQTSGRSAGRVPSPLRAGRGTSKSPGRR
jgi:cholesterol oxidase